MVVLLVVLMFAAFIVADYMLNREKYQVPAEKPARPQPVLERVPGAAVVQGIAIPDSIFFHPGHTWLAQEGPQLARVGIDEFAARLLSKPQSVGLPPVARWVRQGERAFRVEQDGHAAELVSPVEGEIVELNRELLQDPALLRSDPYGRGWLLRMRTPDLPISVRNLLSGSLARHWMEDSLARLRQFFAPTALAVAQDGGPLLEGLATGLDDAAWKKLNAEFFRT